MRFLTSLFCFAVLACNPLFAEGTRELAPNGVIDIMGNTTTDVAALHINHPSYNSFAAYDNPNPQSKLFIHIKDPSAECIFLGFNWAHNNVTSANPPRITFEYRIKDPNGNIVFGPISVTPTTANIQTWAEGFAGPMQVHGPGGYNALQVTSTDLVSQGWTGAGDYTIEFRDEEVNDLLIDFWDITVADCSNITPVERKGRVWSYNWSIFAINDFNFPNRPFNGAFYVCAPDPDNPEASFVTKIDFNGSGFRPAAFNIAFNSFGIQNTGNVIVDRRSVELTNATQAEYAIFLNDPVDICVTAEVGEITVLGISRCSGEDYCIKFTASKAGLVPLLLDFDGGDHIYTPGTADVIIAHVVTQSQVGIPTCIYWDGLDGLGNPLPENVGTQIPITFGYAQGIYHFPIYDAELMTNGFSLQSVRPPSSIPKLYYDDTNITVPSGSGEPPFDLTGCNTPCHRWLNYTQPNTPGFGNLNTINSWWFSQLSVFEDVFFLPAYYNCEIEGPSSICQGGTSQLAYQPVVYPEGAQGGEIIHAVWSGPAIIGPNTGSSITIGDSGTYILKVQWLTDLGDTCQTECEYEVTVDPPGMATIDTLIVQGETIEINGETYNQGGQYMQELTTAEGCDSLLIININVLQTVIHYDLNGCVSYIADGSGMVYTEFIPSYPQPLSCAEITADTLYRENPQMNKHSCTAGVNSSIAMCVSALDGCTYIAGHDASVVIEVNITPDPDTAVHLTGFSFYEKAPTTYEWINGESGPNNYPTWFRVRVLKNGTEIFLSAAMPTMQSWHEVVFDFLDNDEFLVKDPTLFRFEMLPYCPVGNGATVAAWDLDEINIVASCASLAGFNKSIAGTITTEYGVPLSKVEIQLFDYPGFTNQISSISEAAGTYLIENVIPEADYYVRCYYNKDFLNGVNTLDLVHLQKHLLGIKTFESPIQFIAADANKSNSISIIDVVELRKLILGIYTELPKNTSWRYGITGQDLDVNHPWQFKESYIINDLDRHMTGMDFIGVKIGDIDGTAEPDIQSPSWEPRADNKITLQIKDQILPAGIPSRIDVASGQLLDMAGMQLALKLNEGQILDIEGGMLDLADENFVVMPDGILRISWNSISSLTVAESETLFSFIVVPDREILLSELLSLENEVLPAEAYLGEDLETYTIALDLNLSEIPTNENILFPCEPNPFSESTNIRFQLENSGHITLGFYDLSGRLLAEKSGGYNQGMNSIEITRNELGEYTGMLLCQLRGEGFVAVQKLVMHE